MKVYHNFWIIYGSFKNPLKFDLTLRYVVCEGVSDIIVREAKLLISVSTDSKLSYVDK